VRLKTSFLIGIFTFTLLACANSNNNVGTDAKQSLDIQSSRDVQPEQGTQADSALTDKGTQTDHGTTDNGIGSDVSVTDIPGVDANAPDPKCQKLAEGTVRDFDVDGTPRTFILNLPKGVDTGGPWPVIFNWHGYQDTASNMSGLLYYRVNGKAYPFIQVTPEDLDAVPKEGLNWYMLTVTDPDKDKDVRLFDEVLKCLETRWNIDQDRIHSVGFSAGSIMTDLLGVVRGDKLASIATYSGAYFSDEANVTALGSMSSWVSWPPMTTKNTYTQLMVNGGPQDNYMNVIKFNVSGANDTKWLSDMGHDVIHCQHTLGHTIPPEFNDGGFKLIEFFAAHPRNNGPSPWAKGIPKDYPAYCTFVSGHKTTN